MAAYLMKKKTHQPWQNSYSATGREFNLYKIFICLILFLSMLLHANRL